MRVDEALAEGLETAWTAAAGAGLAYRVAPEIAIGAALWRAGLEGAGADEVVWAGGPRLLLAPFAARGWDADPILAFGLEALSIEDGEERSPAFLFGAGLRSRLGSRWTVEAGIRNRFLTIDEEPVDGVATGRDATLWEIALGLGWAPGGRRGG